MKKLALAAFLFSLPIASFGQVTIGDLKVESLQSLFDRNNDRLWDDFGGFKMDSSEIWISGLPSMLFGKKGDQVILLAFKKDIDQDSVRKMIIQQLNKQFGEYKEVEVPMSGFSYEWEKEENEIQYVFSLSKDNDVGALTISQL